MEIACVVKSWYNNSFWRKEKKKKKNQKETAVCYANNEHYTLNDCLLDFPRVLSKGEGRILCLTCLAGNASCFSRTSTVTIAPFLSPHKTAFPYNNKQRWVPKTI